MGHTSHHSAASSNHPHLRAGQAAGPTGRSTLTLALTSRLSPGGRIRLSTDGRSAARAGQDDPDRDGVVESFESGSGPGLLHLGAAGLSLELAPDLAWWRELGRAYVAAACAAVDPLAPDRVVAPAPDVAALHHQLETVPPMVGGELVDEGLLRALWAELDGALRDAVAAHEGEVEGWLEAVGDGRHAAGRVCLHIAENKRDPQHPFAFIATYARPRPGRAGLQYLPLSRALQEFAGAGNRARLLALLRPLQRAARNSELVRELVQSGDIYHPLAWTLAQAHALLREAERLEKAGLVLRLPGWWRRGRGVRPQVQVTVGESTPSRVGLAALLSFQVQVSLGDEVLSAEEMAQILEATSGLVLLKGRWVEVDPDALGEVLDQWQGVEAQAADGGVGFLEAARLLAGASVETADSTLDLDTRPDWTQVVAGRWLREQLEALRSPEVAQKILDGAGLDATLRPYQAKGVQWLWTLYGLGLGGCLADDMGLGKTIQVIALLSLLHGRGGGDDGGDVDEGADEGTDGSEEAYPLDLLVVPASLVENWRAELARFAPHLRVLVAHASAIPSRRLKALPAEELEAHQVVITTYGTVRRTPWMAERAWRCVVLDEAQAIKNPGARQTRAVKALQARWRLALTGTPVENRLGDLWSLFDFLNPGLLGSAKAFGRFCKAMSQDPVDGYAPLRRLVGPYVLRRLKTDRSVIADLPDKTEVEAHCLLKKPQATLYKQAVDELARLIGAAEGMERRGAVLAALMRFKQICNHPSQWLGDGDFDPRHSGKFERLAALCEPIAARQEKVLVFTQFRAMTEPLRRHLEAHMGRTGLVLHGGTPVKRRAGLVARFQEDEEVGFMVLSLKAGGTGLNLTAANHVVHFDRWWNPAVENQATDRAYRIGQRRNVLVHKFVCQGTVEERIAAMLADKQRLSDQVLDGGGDLRLTELSDEELLEVVSLDMSRAVTS